MLERKIVNNDQPGVRRSVRSTHGAPSWEERLTLANKERRSAQASDQPKKLLGLLRGKHRKD